MPERLFSETARRVPSPEDEVRKELVKAVERTDINFNSETLRGRFGSWGATASYEWSLEADGDETVVVQRFSPSDWISFGAFSIVPIVALVSATMLLVDRISILFILTTYTLFLVPIVPLLWYRAAPSPLDRLGASRWEYTEGLAVGLNACGVPLVIWIVFIVCLGLLRVEVLLDKLDLVVFGLFLTSAVPTAVVYELEQQDRLETLRVERELFSPRQQWVETLTTGLWATVVSLLEWSLHLPSETDDLTVPYRTVEAEFGPGRLDAAIRSIREAADSVGINVDTDLSAVEDDHWIDGGEMRDFITLGRYEWTIRRRNGDDDASRIVVEETLYVSSNVLGIFQRATLVGAGVLTLVTIGDPVPPLPFDSSLAVAITYTFVTLLAAPTYAIILLYIVVRPKNLPVGLDLADPGSRLRRKWLQIEPFVVATTIFTVGGVVSNVFTFQFQTVVSASCVAGLLAVVLLAEVRYESVGRWMESIPVSYPTPPFGPWLAAAFYIAFPAIQLLILIELPQIADETARATTVALTTLLAVVTLSRESYSSLGEAVAKFESREDGDHPLRRWILYTVAVVTSVGSIALVAFTAEIQAETARSTAETMFYVGPSLLLVGFPLLGVVYQIGSKALTLYSLFEHSHRVDPETVGIGSETVEAELRLFDGPVGTSTGVTLRDGVVFLSRGDAELLDPPELAALLAHEDAHATRYADGRLSVLAPLIAAVTLTGQNLLLAALDFRGREFRADDYAADTTSPRQVRRALSEVHAERHSPNTEEARDAGRVDSSGPHVVPGPAFGSFRPPESELSVLQRLFGTIYGGFTISRAHPSVEARIDRLRQREREED